MSRSIFLAFLKEYILLLAAEFDRAEKEKQKERESEGEAERERGWLSLFHTPPPSPPLSFFSPSPFLLSPGFLSLPSSRTCVGRPIVKTPVNLYDSFVWFKTLSPSEEQLSEIRRDLLLELVNRLGEGRLDTGKARKGHIGKVKQENGGMLRGGRAHDQGRKEKNAC